MKLALASFVGDVCGCPHSEFKEMKAYYIAEHDHQESEARWRVRAVENYRDAEAAHAETVHAISLRCQ